jgi:hypothetical protein
VLGLAFAIDEHRQVAADADGLHRVEEKEAIAAEEVLRVVLRRRQEHVYAGVVEQLVELCCVEWQRSANLCIQH